ncbi:MAG: hypothetical protein ABI570_00365 [Ilumatobacteraceae bacterium]
MRILRSAVLVAVAAIVCLAPPVFASSSSSGETTPTSIYTYNLPGSVGDCVGLYPKPNCGTEPVLSGDRGGVMQYATFGVIILGLAIIMTVIARSVIRTDRIKKLEAEADLLSGATSADLP